MVDKNNLLISDLKPEGSEALLFQRTRYRPSHYDHILRVKGYVPYELSIWCYLGIGDVGGRL